MLYLHVLIGRHPAWMCAPLSKWFIIYNNILKPTYIYIYIYSIQKYCHNYNYVYIYITQWYFTWCYPRSTLPGSLRCWEWPVHPASAQSRRLSKAAQGWQMRRWICWQKPPQWGRRTDEIWWNPVFENWICIDIWLVVWNFCFFPYIGNNHPNWLIFFRVVETTNQIFNEI